MSASIGLKSVKELFDMSFFIPRYQRGYRWGETQVLNLLNDILEFIDKGKKGIYCVQPLVVQQIQKSSGVFFWEVIDGQQRLTTISIILQVIGIKRPYSLDYAVLEKKSDKDVGSEIVNSIMSLSDNDASGEINLFHMAQCRSTVQRWLKNKDCNEILETIKHKVKFIWYQNEKEEPIKIFTRLNIGKIALTNSELIKALFLNRDNFFGQVTSEQLAIAQQWDTIEATLQNDEFWLFINQHYKEYNKPTRIDFIFDFICNNHRLKDYDSINSSNTVDDEYRTFNYFYEIYQNTERPSGAFLKVWEEVRVLFGIFNEWYSNIKFYHYVGFVITCEAVSLKDLVDNWEKHDKVSFINKYLFGIIRNTCLRQCGELERQYTVGNKTEARPLLLLHNVQKIVNQNRIMMENQQYKMAVFYKFPFHLFKKEHWDVEHIDSSIDNKMEEKDQQSWILSTYQCLTEEQKKNEELQKRLVSFFESEAQGDDKRNAVFEPIMSLMLDMVGWQDVGKDELWKNHIWNYTLLDRTTNRSYHNAIFPVKRLHIIGKENGRVPKLKWSKEQKCVVPDTPEQKKSAFVPIVTKEVFQKTYSVQLGNLTRWDESDAMAYLEDIRKTLSYVPMDIVDEKGNVLYFNFLR